MSYISKISLDDSNLPPPTPEIDQERKVAIFDLLEGNSFTLPKLWIIVSGYITTKIVSNAQCVARPQKITNCIVVELVLKQIKDERYKIIRWGGL